jgi:mannopine transport system permease protein
MMPDPVAGAADRGRGRMVLAALAPFLLLTLFFYMIPTLRMLARSVLEPAPGLAQLAAVVSSPLYRQVFWTTLRISLFVTIFSIVLAFPVAHVANRCGPLLRNIVFAIVLIPFWTSLLVRVYGWTFLLQRTGLFNKLLQSAGMTDGPLKLLYTEGAVILGITHYMLPFMIFSIFAALRSIDDRLARAAAVMGARPLRVFFTITLPLATPGIVAGSLLVFIGSLGFYVTPALMGSPRETMIANLITFQVKDALNWPRASAIAVVLTAAVAVLCWLYFRFTERAGATRTLP